VINTLVLYVLSRWAGRPLTAPEFIDPATLEDATEAPAASRGARPPAVAATPSRRAKHGHRLIVPALLATVIALDQATKWWAWRHAPGAVINPGGDLLVGRMVGRLYVGRVTGAALDLLDFGLLSTAVWVLMRRPRLATIVVPGALMLGGWASNLLDRLGMHYFTAPGSVRGAVDFIPVGGPQCNLADFFIIGATPLFLLAVGFRGRRAANQPAITRAAARATPYRLSAQARVPAVACGGIIVVAVALGAANYCQVSHARRHVSAQADRRARPTVPPGAPAVLMGRGQRGEEAFRPTARTDPGLAYVMATLSYTNETSAGTGMVLTSTGEVLTNNHVIEGARRSR
jgi:lipoprotein signal peptidase